MSRMLETLCGVAFGAVLAVAIQNAQPAPLPVTVNPPVCNLTLQPDETPVACESKSNPPDDSASEPKP